MLRDILRIVNKVLTWVPLHNKNTTSNDLINQRPTNWNSTQFNVNERRNFFVITMSFYRHFLRVAGVAFLILYISKSAGMRVGRNSRRRECCVRGWRINAKSLRKEKLLNSVLGRRPAALPWIIMFTFTYLHSAQFPLLVGFGCDGDFSWLRESHLKSAANCDEKWDVACSLIF